MKLNTTSIDNTFLKFFNTLIILLILKKVFKILGIGTTSGYFFNLNVFKEKSFPKIKKQEF